MFPALYNRDRCSLIKNTINLNRSYYYLSAFHLAITFAYFISEFTCYILPHSATFENNMKNIGSIANIICWLNFWDDHIVSGETEILTTNSYLYLNFMNHYDYVFATVFRTFDCLCKLSKKLVHSFHMIECFFSRQI